MKISEATIKKFDAVKMMRGIRDQVDKEIQGMTFEQEKEYFRKGAEKLKRQLKQEGNIR